MRTIAITLLLGACAGQPPSSGPLDPSGDEAPGQVVAVVGQTMDYFVPWTPITSSTVATDGIAPAASSISAEDGGYALDVPVASKLFAIVSHDGYRPTRNAVFSVDADDLVHDLSIVSLADSRRQYVTLGKTPTAGMAVVFADLVDDGGEPVAGVALDQIALVDTAGVAVPVLGPFAFGTTGDIDPSATATLVGNGRARVAFLEVPAGTLELRIAGRAGDPVIADVGGATLVTISSVAVAAGNPDPSFARDIHPRLQTAANGGLGCANCHTLGGAGAVLELDGPPDLVLERLLAHPGVIDTADPAASLLLARPTYEAAPAPQDHPNASFLDANDPDYQLIRRWIENGAKP